jgi:hypothetical protein
VAAKPFLEKVTEANQARRIRRVTTAARARARLRDPRLALVLALVAATVAYAPVLRSPPWLDDYIYFSAARDMGDGHFVRLVFTPWSWDPAFTFTRDYWRPLSFLYFKVAEPVFGGHVLPYHLVNLGIHLAAVVLVWVLARRLDARPAVAGVAALVFALYPGSNEAVAWISSFNSAALPLMLGSWLVFLTATRDKASNWRRLWAAAALLALALMFRETAVSLLAPIGLWYILMQRRDDWRAWRTYLPFVPYALVCAVYFVIRTKLFTEPAANSDIYRLDGSFPEHWWYLVKSALLPFREPVLGWRVRAQEVAGSLLLLSLLPFVLLRRWRYVALIIGLVASITPSAGNTLGVGQRYLYCSTPLVALVLGMLAADAREWFEARRGPRPAPPLVPIGLATFAIVTGIYLVWDRNANWVDGGPERQQAWADELRAEYPTLPDGGVLYCVNVPLELAIYDGAELAPVVRWYYPEVGRAALAPDPATIPALSPADRVFIAGDGKLLGDTRPER